MSSWGLNMTEPVELGFRLSPQQLRAWRRQKEEGTSCAVPGALHLEGDLDRRALRRALAATVARHEILRTAFRLPAGLSLPLQVILEPGPVSLPEIDLQGLAVESRPAAAALLGELGGPPFDLARGEGWRAALVRLAPGEHALLWVLSAVCADPGAFAPLAADLLSAYARQRAGGGGAPEPPLQVVDAAEWQNSLLEGDDATEGLEVWREHWREQEIEGRLALPLPLEENKPESEPVPGPFAPREQPVPLAREAAGALARLAAAWGCAQQVLLLTAWKAVIQRGTGRDESVVGVLYPGRDAEELREVVGPLARSLPVAARFRPEAPLREAVAEVQQAMKRAESWGEYFSWEHVAGREHGTGGFPAGFVAGTPSWSRAVDGLRAAAPGLSGHGAAVDRFSLSLEWSGEGEELRLAVAYDPRRFRREAVRSLAGRLAALLGSVAARPGLPLNEHPAMGEDEQRRWLDLSVAPPAADRGREGQTLHAVFEEQADRTPDRLAVTAGDGRLTFRELDVRANRLAHHLRAAGAGPEEIVALCLERSVAAVVALLAVWKAGAAYIPLDPTQPAERLAWLLEDTGAPLLVTDARLASSLPGAGSLPGVRTVRLDDLTGEAAAIAQQAAGRPAGGAGPRHLAYVIYTSGSTGRPKGVQVEHRSALHLLAALETAVLDPLAESGQRPDPLLASLNAPMIFDASVQQLALLLAGHALCVVPQDIRADGEALVAFLRDQGVDLLDCTPSQLRLLVSAGLLDGPGGPRIVLTAGEAVDEPLWRRLSQAAQAERTVSFNLYGPTEATVDATFHRIPPGSTRPTIGRPLAGYEVFLLDRFLQPVPPGAPGELCLGGAGLARGYLRRPDLTAERFVPHPFAGRPGERLYRTGDLGRHLPNGDLEGDLEILGRLDHQVKIRGFRIELGEIEAALAEQPGVREAVVVVQESGVSGDGERRLVAWLTGDAPADALREALRQRLPDFMVPSALVSLAALPLTPNGKVDRRALSRQEIPGRAPVPPRTVTELTVSQAFEELLGVPVGAEDSFFALGGHSLLSVRLMARLRRQFGCDLPIAELFAHPTVTALARRLDAEGGLPWSPLVPVQPLGEQTPVFCVHPGGGEVLCYYDLARRLGTDQPFYGLQARPVKDETAPPRTTIEEMAAEYLDAVRSRQPRGPYLLAGYSLGGTVAFEMARQLTGAGEEVALLALLDTELPPGDETAEFDTAAMIATILRQRAREHGQPLEIDAEALRALALDDQLARALEILRGLGALAAEIDLPLLRSLVLGYCSRETALERYRAPLWPGRITLLRARDVDPASVREMTPRRRQILDDPTLGWATVAAGGVEVHAVPGYHHSILQGPNLETLAETLRACIAGPRQPQLA
jgi:amino acid adenylation domain-containing protein